MLPTSAERDQRYRPPWRVLVQHVQSRTEQHVRYCTEYWTCTKNHGYKLRACQASSSTILPSQHKDIIAGFCRAHRDLQCSTGHVPNREITSLAAGRIRTSSEGSAGGGRKSERETLCSHRQCRYILTFPHVRLHYRPGRSLAPGRCRYSPSIST